jgi:hypothetical protein
MNKGKLRESLIKSSHKQNIIFVKMSVSLQIALAAQTQLAEGVTMKL